MSNKKSASMRKNPSNYKQTLKNGIVNQKQAELNLLNQMERSGTLNDKISALSIKVEESYQPGKHLDVKTLDEIISIAKKKSRYHNEAAILGLSELFNHTLIPPKSKETLSSHKSPVSENLKKKYLEFIDILKQHSQDTVDHHKKLIIRTLSELASSKDEQRVYVIEAIINKLGDPSSSISTCVILEANEMVRKNRETLLPIIQSISRFLSRKNNSSNSKFYSIVLLNSLKIKPGETEAVKLLLQIYMNHFPFFIKESSNQGNKVISLLLKGVNKIFPLCTEKKEIYTEFFQREIESFYRLTHFSMNSTIQMQAIRFIYQAETASGFLTDRFYRSLYQFILPTPALTELSSKTVSVLADTLREAIKEDFDESRIKAFCKRILQCCLLTEANVTLGLLLLVSEVFKAHESLWKMMNEPPEEEEEELYNDVPDSENEEEIIIEELPGPKIYDPLKREPKYCNSNETTFYELKVLSINSHPTVAKWSKELMMGQSVVYESDPVLDFSFINYLDRFSYRKPKTKLIENLKGERPRRSLLEEAVNSELFRGMEEGSVREEERFFHKYFRLKGVPEIEGSEEDESEYELPSKEPSLGVFVSQEKYYRNK